MVDLVGTQAQHHASSTPVTAENALRIDRATLGNDAPLALFRLVRLVALEEILGRGAPATAYIAGRRLGHALGLPNLEAFLQLCKDLKIGRIEVPKMDSDGLYVDVFECVTCSGLQPVGRKLCSFEGGLIAGVVESTLGRKAKASEITCIGGLGHRSCGFSVVLGAKANSHSEQ